MMASVNDRAARLFETGYRARWNGAGTLEIRNVDGAAYLVDAKTGACGCPFYRAHQGRHPCKHSFGLAAASFQAARLPPTGAAPAAESMGRP